MSLGESSTSDDQAVQATNDDATACKKYAVQKCYWKDNFVKFFCRSSEKKSPEISRGYYARVMAFRTLVEKFIRRTERKCQVVSLGAGFDTLYWQLHSDGLVPKMFLEVDFNSVVSRKTYIISSKAVLRDVLANAVFSEEGVWSDQYHLLAGDLRTMPMLGEKIISRGIDTSLPTMVLTECVLVYMEPDKSVEVIGWFGSHFSSALFLNYEPIRPMDRFGEAMLANLKYRKCSLLGIRACPDLDSQKLRFLNNSWANSWAMDMSQVYASFPVEEQRRIEQIEFLDEQELLMQLLQHYCLSCGWNDATSIGLDSITLTTP